MGLGLEPRDTGKGQGEEGMSMGEDPRLGEWQGRKG